MPIIVQSRTRFLPYLSESAPILGETKNWSVLGVLDFSLVLRGRVTSLTHENTEPIRPPISFINSESLWVYLNATHPKGPRPIAAIELPVYTIDFGQNGRRLMSWTGNLKGPSFLSNTTSFQLACTAEEYVFKAHQGVPFDDTREQWKRYSESE